MGAICNRLGYDRVGIRSLGSLILLYQYESSKVSWNDLETSFLQEDIGLYKVIVFFIFHAIT